MPSPDDDPIAQLRARFHDAEVGVPTGRLGRLWRTGRAAAGVATRVLGSRGGDGATDVAAMATLASRLGELKGIAMKAGQLLGYVDPTLPAPMRDLLAVLQTQAPASPPEAIDATLDAAFGPRAAVLRAAIERAPVAVASIGQVHRGVLPDGTRVAVKIRHPGIEEALRADFRNAAIGSAFARVMPGGASVRGMIDEARTAMLEECDLGLEAERQAQFASWYAGHPTLRIPALVPAWCAPTVLTSRWVEGRSLDAFLATAPSQAARDRVGVALFELFIGTLYQRGAFHADPHPGNFAIRDDGQVVIYDFGCVRRYAPELVAALAALVRAVRGDDADEIDAAMRAIGATPAVKPAARTHQRALLRGFFAPLLVEGPHAITADPTLTSPDVFRDKRALLGLALPGPLLFLLRVRFGLYAVLARIGAVADWAALERAWVQPTPAPPRSAAAG